MSRGRAARGVVGWVKPVTVQGPPLGLGSRRVRKLYVYGPLQQSDVFQRRRRGRVVQAPQVDPIAALTKVD